MRIRLYKRQPVKVTVPTKDKNGKAIKGKAADRAAYLFEKEQDVRVKRPTLLTFLLGDGFTKLPTVPNADRLKKFDRPKDAGYEIPLDSLGRIVKKKSPEEWTPVEAGSTKESVRRWIVDNLGQFGFSEESITVVVDDD